MKIGIVTYHKSHNYGALLQAVATRVFLERRGHEVFYLDYWPSYHKQYYAFFSLLEMKRRGLKCGMKYLNETIKYRKTKQKRIEAFEKFISLYIQPYCINIHEKCDVIVYGSDQIWRKQSALHTYNSVYWGIGDFNSNLNISYAASMGILPIKDKEKEILSQYFKNLDYISVREEDLRQFVQSLGFDCEINIDPTLLIKKEDWNTILGLSDDYREDKYALFYDLQRESFDIDEINRFVSQNGLVLKTICGNANKNETNNIITTAGPLGFIKLVKDAEFVFTSSFHGLVFSIIYNKPFYAAFRNNAGRAKSLLQQIGLNDRLLTPLSKIPNKQEYINFKEINLVLDEFRQNSVQYFEKVNL